VSRLASLLPIAALAVGMAASLWFIAELGYLDPMASLDARAAAAADQLTALSDREAKSQAALVAAAGNRTRGNIEPYIAKTSGEGPPTAVLLGQVRTAIASAHGMAISTQASEQPLAGDYVKLAVLVRARFDEPGFIGFVRTLETGSPRLLFQSAEAHPLPPGQQGSRPLEMTATLLGFASHAD
jgi:hypothetical protein